METTLDMFDPDPLPPIARRSDPVTSKIAAVQHSKSKRQKQLNLLRALIKEFPHQTRREYSKILEGRGYSETDAFQIPNKRVSDLKRLKEVDVGRIRKCRFSKKKCETYYVRSDHL